jgi:hypothetical protein
VNAFIAQHGQPDVIIIARYRETDAHDVEQSTEIAPEKIVYVSCNSATKRVVCMMDENTKWLAYVLWICFHKMRRECGSLERR